MYTNEEQEEFLIALEEEFETSNQLLKDKWNAFMSYMQSNKQNWTDEQYFYFEQRVIDIDRSVDYMIKQIEGPIRQFFDDKIKYLNEHRK